MIVKRKNHMYTSKRDMVYGYGFVDTMKDIGSYISQNRDLIAKPLLSAAGEVGALALTEGSKALLRKLTKNKSDRSNALSPESVMLLDELSKSGGGIKRF